MNTENISRKLLPIAERMEPNEGMEKSQLDQELNKEGGGYEEDIETESVEGKGKGRHILERTHHDYEDYQETQETQETQEEQRRRLEGEQNDEEEEKQFAPKMRKRSNAPFESQEEDEDDAIDEQSFRVSALFMANRYYLTNTSSGS